MAVLGGGKKKKRTKNKKETVTINADGSRTVTVTKNKTRTKVKSSKRNTTPRKKVATVSTLKPYGIQKQKINIPKVKILAKPIKVEPKMTPSQLAMAKTVDRQVAANKREEQWQSVVRNSQPLSTSPSIPNRKATFPKRKTKRQRRKERQQSSTYYLN
tara:strand:+ start:151 stop:624 length:474 start_codon:yes stop_codon:yes gene_type:complete